MSASYSSLNPLNELIETSLELNCALTDVKFAEAMDERDPLRTFRQLFCYPKKCDLPDISEALKTSDEECVYLCGHSLGLMPKATTEYVQRQLDKWAAMGVHGHRNGELPWAFCDECVVEQMAQLVGALTEEVAVMNSLTINEHLLLISFYRPTPARHKILIEHHAFPADHYCMESQIRLHGYDPATSLICLKPRMGEHTLRTEDIVKVIEDEGDSIAVIVLPGVQYYTGQLIDMLTVTKAGQKKGCYVGFDLAHAVGNVELELHDWNVDFACWCTYKYVNSGAGGIGGAFIHARHANNDFPKLLGWWGHRMETRFDMSNVLELSPGAAGYRVSNPPGLLAASLKASLDIFSKTSMSALRQKSKLLTAYLEYLLMYYYGKEDQDNLSSTSLSNKAPNRSRSANKPSIMILTPGDPEQRGCQLSISLSIPVGPLFNELSQRGVVLDERQPNVLRIAPIPLYNTFQDCHRFVEILHQAVQVVCQ
jgi:kynureninase